MLRYNTSQTLDKDIDQLTFNGTQISNENGDNNFNTVRDEGPPGSGQVSINRLKESKNGKTVIKPAMKASDLDYIFVNSVPQT